MQLSGAAALITGGKRIGVVIAKAFAAAGMDVALSYNNSRVEAEHAAGGIALTEALALELAGDQILVNAVAPGPIVPPPGTTDEERRAVEDATPLGRWGGPDAIVRAVMFLVETDFVTGETIRVDGGRHVK